MLSRFSQDGVNNSSKFQETIVILHQLYDNTVTVTTQQFGKKTSKNYVSPFRHVKLDVLGKRDNLAGTGYGPHVWTNDLESMSENGSEIY